MLPEIDQRLQEIEEVRPFSEVKKKKKDRVN